MILTNCYERRTARKSKSVTKYYLTIKSANGKLSKARAALKRQSLYPVEVSNMFEDGTTLLTKLIHSLHTGTWGIQIRIQHLHMIDFISLKAVL